MTDPFDVATTRQRAFVLVAILAYFVLFVVDITTDIAAAAALTDVVIAVLAIPAGAVVVRRATAAADTDWIAVAAGVSFFVAGLAVGYSGLAALTDLPAIPALEPLGSAALLLALVLYLYRTWE